MLFGALATALAIARALAASTPHLAEHVEVRVRGPAAIATRPAAAAHLDESILAVVGPDPGRRMALALTAAGAPDGVVVATRDGMPAAAHDGAVDVNLDVNTDPFSAERTGAGVVSIDVQDAAPAARWTFHVAPGLWTSSHADPVFPSARRESRAPSASLAGPVGRWSAALSGAYTSGSAQAIYVRGGAGEADETLDVAPPSRTTDWQWSGGLRRSDGRFAVRLDGRRFRATNAGIDAVTGPAAARAIDTARMQATATWRGTLAGSVWRVGASAAVADTRVTAPDTMGRIWAGRLFDGGPEAVADRSRSRDVRLHAVAESPGHWLAGLSVDAGRRALDRRWNSGGVQLGAAGTAIGALLSFPSGMTAANADVVSAAAFGQRVLAATERLFVRVGGRIDAEAGRRLMLSPRLSAGFSLAGLLLGANAGVFADRSDPDLLAETAVHNSAARTLTRLSDAATFPLVGTGEPGRRRDVVARLALARAVGGALISVEHTATRGFGLSGTTRWLDGDRLIDAIDTGRRLLRHDSRVRLDASTRGGRVTLYVARTRAVDDSDGPFAMAALDARGERGPASGVPAWSAGGVAATTLGGVQIVATAAFAAGLPYTRVDGTDPAGLLTFAGRAGGRNAARRPGRRDVAVYLAPVSPFRWRALRIAAGVRLENLLGRLSPLDVVRDVTSPLAGRAVGSAPGRAVSVWLTAGK